MVDQYSYIHGQFQSTVIDLKADDTITDWEARLRSIGWEKISQFPEHRNAEFAHVRAYIYRHHEAGTYFVEILLDDTTVMHVLCPDGLDLMLLHRDFLTPLCRSGDADIYIDAVIEATHCLFDQERGLVCAKRVKEHDQMLERYYEQQPKQNKAAG